MFFKLKNNKIKEVISELKKASKTHAGQAEKLQSALSKNSINLSGNTPKQNKKLMQEYKDKHMRRTRPIPEGGGIKTRMGTAPSAPKAIYDLVKSVLPKRMGKFKHSDAPDAKGKFKSLSASSLASWLIKTRKGNLSRIISSLNQQVVFNRGKNPSYAKKMKTTMNIVRKRLGKDKKKA